MVLLAGFVCAVAPAQQPSKTEMEKLLNESLEQLDPVARKQVIESMKKNTGKAMPGRISTNNNEQPVVPAKDSRRIAALPKSILDDMQLKKYLETTVAKIEAIAAIPAKEISKQIVTTLQSSKMLDKKHLAIAATALGIIGEHEASLLLMGKSILQDINDPDNLNGYAVFLIQNGGGHLALPILQQLNRRFPGNSTVLNNLGQAWFELGDLDNASKYLDTCLRFMASHSQASYTKAIIEEKKGDTKKAAEDVKKSLQQSFNPAKVAMLKRLGGAVDVNYINLDVNRSENGYSLGKYVNLDFDFYYSDEARRALLPQWAGYINALREKKAASDAAADMLQSSDAAASGQSFAAGSGPAFIVEKANTLLSALYGKYQDFQMANLKTSTEMDLEFGQVTSKLPANAGTGGDKCDGIGAYKTWVYEYNKRLKDFRTKTITQARSFIEDIVPVLRYVSFSDAVFQLQKQQLENDFIGYCMGTGTTPFDFQPGCNTCDILVTDCTEGEHKEQQPVKLTLPDFDETHCNTHGSINLVVLKYKWDCNVETVEFDASYSGLKIKGKIRDNWVKETRKGNVEVTFVKSVGIESVGPVTIKAGGGGGVFVEFTEKGITDVGAIGQVKVKAGKVTIAGAEGRVGLNSGPTLSGSGILSGVSIK
jgi:Flp pilus assembly protein TadD